MDIYTNTPYTYRICWSKTGMNYYGVRYAVDCRPSDLFVTYFTSSDYVAEYIIEHGLPDIIEVRKVFTSEDRVTRARNFEHRVLRRMKVKSRGDYLNKSDNKSWELTPEDYLRIAAQLSTHMVKKWQTEEYRNKMCGEAGTARLKKAWENESKRTARQLQRGDKAANYNSTIYSFTHTDGRVVTATQLQLEQLYGVHQGNLSQVINGKTKSANGWRLSTTPESAVRGRNPKLNFIHSAGLVEDTTVNELVEKYNLIRKYVLRMISGKEKSYKGWSVMNR